jgi:hypothetical protein
MLTRMFHLYCVLQSLGATSLCVVPSLLCGHRTFRSLRRASGGWFSSWARLPMRFVARRRTHTLLRTPCLALRPGPRFAWRTSVREPCMMRFPARRGGMGGVANCFLLRRFSCESDGIVDRESGTICAVCGQKAGEMRAERPKPTATLILRYEFGKNCGESCLSWIWAGHLLVDHHDESDWGS